MLKKEQWNGFKGRLWKEEINVRDFIQNNYKPYYGDESFLAGPTELQINYGGNYKNFKKKNVLKVEFLIWKHMLFLG